MEKMERGAILKGGYRYLLWRIWDNSKDIILYIGLNPSTADSEKDDATIKKLIRLTKALGYGGFRVVNLFGRICTDSSKLMYEDNPIGKKNDDFLMEFVESSKVIVCMWGSYKNMMMAPRASLVRRYIRTKAKKQLFCFCENKDGSPKHPLYLKEKGISLSPYNSWTK